MNNQQETLVLVDRSDHQIGLCEKLETHRRGLLHRAFSVILYRDDQILLQRRNLSKYHSGGLWANAACGHPRPDEPTVSGATRRLKEEMGLSCTLRPIGSTIYRAELDHDMVEHELVHLFAGICVDEPSPDPDEVMDWRWYSVKQFRKHVESSSAYTFWIREYVRRGLI